MRFRYDIRASVKELVLEEQQVDTAASKRLILYNDDHNTFDWVIESLMEVCDHSAEQAEQCAWLVHFKGKYAVLNGSFDFLLPRRRALESRGLTATVE